MFCPECGTPFEDAAKFCTECGTRLKDVSFKRSSSKKPKTVVIAVLVIATTLVSALAAMYFINAGPAEVYARDCARVSDILSLRLALSMYRTDKGSYPDTLDMLVPAYLKEVPRDPLEGKPIGFNPAEEEFGGSEYTYRYVPEDEGGGYTLLSCNEWKERKVIRVTPYE